MWVLFSRDTTASFVSDLDAISKHSVGQEESVEEVDREESEVSQPLEESVRRGVADLGHLAVVQSSAKPGGEKLVKIAKRNL